MLRMRVKQMRKFEGVFPIVITTFHDDGSLDLESQRRLVRFLLDAGAHGLGLFGTASEGYTLSDAERTTLTKIITDEVAGCVPVVVSTGHTGTGVAVALSLEAERAGADAVMVLPPYFLRPDAEGLFHYYRAISDAISIPIMIQDAPLMTQVTLSATILSRMGLELERVQMVKVESSPTAPKVSELSALAGDSLTLFGGLNGQFFLEELGRGARGTMPGSDMTDMFVRVWDLYQLGKVAEARTEFNRYLPLIRYELQPGLGVSVMKHNLHSGGIIASPRVRHPTGSIDKIGLRELEELQCGLEMLVLQWNQ
jgi:2-keto-3-deoxy-L-arabinonate dehydratase